MDRIGEYIHGEYFKDNNIKLYKLTHDNEKHFDHQYTTGVNFDKNPFNADVSSRCAKGGLYFSDKDDVLAWLKPTTRYIRPIVLDDRTPVVWFKRQLDPRIKDAGSYKLMPTKGRARTMIVGDRLDLFEKETWDIIHANNIEINTWVDRICKWCGHRDRLDILVYLDKMGYIDPGNNMFHTTIYTMSLRKNNVEACEVCLKHGIDADCFFVYTINEMLGHKCTDTLKWLHSKGVDIKVRIDVLLNNPLTMSIDRGYIDWILSELEKS